ncbi:TonB-dependent receptor [Acinetobacter sp. C26M]|uniref:TonB-dependent receptor plug domain-containing protein n=1 Tax=unclassified Acinetobacter TaxID=196816 RepID=UPI0020368923|nr:MULTISPECIES: TonB-dependent receptor [unclassified Acinetobacter]USA45890.1 TonB-dependent receptor [Acinetobacter sp. C26M]USA49373.1 TonB-dependent receptor [Acinetobacter sp. C26G]
MRPNIVNMLSPQFSFKPNFLFASLLAAGLISPSAYAIEQTTDTTAKAPLHVLDTIVVTGTRSEKKLIDSPIRTEIISEDELKRTNAITLKDALENIPGILLREIHGKSGYEISLQGLSSDQVLILIDGLPLAASTSSTVDLDQYLIGGIEHIEVVKGAASAQYGSSAMGGVINIITKKVQDGVSISGQIDIGSYGKQNADGKNTSINNHHQKISIEAANANLKGRIIADQFTNDGFAVEPDAYPRQGDEQKRQQYAIYGAWQASDQVMLWADFNEYKEKDHQRSLNFVPPFYLKQHKIEDIERQRFSAGSQFDLMNTAKVDLKAVHETYDSTSTQTLDGYLSALRNSKQENNHFSSQLTFPKWHKQNWQLGYDWHEEKLEQSNNGKFEMQGGSVKRDRHELYVQNDFNLVTNLDAVIGWRFQNDDDFGDHNAFKLSTKYRFYEQNDLLADLRLSYGQGYRVPNLKERFYSFDHSHLGYIVIGNPNLKPESSDSYQLGLSLVQNERWNADFNLFWNDVKDLIQTDYDNATTLNGITQYSYSNVAKAETKGFESSVKWNLTPYFSLNGAYTYTEAKDKTTNTLLTRRPKHIARLGADYALNDQVDLTFRTRYQSDEYGDSANQHSSPSWITFDSQVDYRINKYISAFAGIDNIFNEQRDFSAAFDYRPISGRYTYMGLRFNWMK